MNASQLPDLLAERGILSPAQREEVLTLEAQTGRRPVSILLNRGFLTEDRLTGTLAQVPGLEDAGLDTRSIPPEMARVLPRAVAEHYAIIPVLATWTAVRLAMADPLDQAAIEAAGAAAQRPIIPLISSFSAVKRALLALYGPQEEA